VGICLRHGRAAETLLTCELAYMDATSNGIGLLLPEKPHLLRGTYVVFGSPGAEGRFEGQGPESSDRGNAVGLQCLRDVLSRAPHADILYVDALGLGWKIQL
jgi:hypothetical protein